MKYELEFTRQLNSSLKIVPLVRTGSHSELF
jgi:mRNA-degrading endonuclease YafQ of YafQ-DinJ toxin-antitoxin module